MSIEEIKKRFIEMTAELVVALDEFSDLQNMERAERGSKKMNQLEAERQILLKELFKDNKSDSMVNYVHDSILAEYDEIPMPKGYWAEALYTYYSVVFRTRYTIVEVHPPKGGTYFLRVPAVGVVHPIGKVFKN
jgi:hypothetical protein